ncbi:T9SS type A sorting domain-containing protein [Riemerella anatipestifer]|nr:T9SS type A sorting domain-containing protein [Riemerella anatipestifer]MDY3471983.1 T9SS type A sorting domain-containing protein [Riemerella anatipestifer]MDY3500096.1 T9SS type A sorting domain-containing protein [Riemerella anatipestifer]MDY3522640.1 T9SS type A sorting domain-containing protein [Riemerella anatipestifer]
MFFSFHNAQRVLPNKATVNIYSLDGKLLSSSRVSSGESINISHLAKGNYIVTVQDNYNKISRKIIKK